MFRRVAHVLTILAAAAFAGCSIHPIPKDVSIYSTDEIVRNVRCEAKDTVRERIRKVLATRPPLSDIIPDQILEPAAFERIKRFAPDLAIKFQNYMGSSIAYQFEFNITETGTGGASAGFAAPFSPGAGWAFGGGASVLKIREGARKFATFETFAGLIKLDCVKHGYVKPSGNPVYPLTGSVGISEVMNTFIDLTELGGGRDTFTDTLTFTTKLNSELSGSITLLPIKNNTRLVRADAKLTAERNDMHKLLVTLTFPKQDIRGTAYVGPVSLSNIDALGRESTLRAQEDLCIAREEEREDRVGSLRQIPPAEYCRNRYQAQRN